MSVAASTAIGIAGLGMGAAGQLMNRRAGNSASQSTTQSAESQRQFDPYTLELMKNLHGQGSGVLSDYMSNPWTAGFFQRQLQRVDQGIGGRANSQIQGLMAPGLGAHVANPSAFMLSQIGKITRGASRERSQSLTDLLLGAENLRRGAAGAAMGYQPLQTGSSTTETENITGNKRQGSFWGDILGMGGNALLSIPMGGPKNNEPGDLKYPIMGDFGF